ncbi:hypothetical protein SCANM63S_02765 [Streptomyces canarius]
MAEQTHVLFVEDDDVIREATQLALERDGFAVTAMPDGLSGLAAPASGRTAPHRAAGTAHRASRDM